MRIVEYPTIRLEKASLTAQVEPASARGSLGTPVNHCLVVVNRQVLLAIELSFLACSYSCAAGSTGVGPSSHWPES